MAKVHNGPEGVAIWLDQEEAERLTRLVGHNCSGILTSLFNELYKAEVKPCQQAFRGGVISL